MLATVHPVLADSGSRVGSQVLESCGVRGRCSNDGRVLQCTSISKSLADGSDGRRLLSNGNVNAANLLLRITGCPVILLIQNRIDCDGSLAGLPVTDNELTLSTANRDHGVNGLKARLQRLMHRLTLHDAGSLQFEGAASLQVRNLSEAVDGFTHGIDHAPQVAVANLD